MRSQSRTMTAPGVSTPAVMDTAANPFNCTVTVILNAGATATYTVEYTTDRPSSATDANGSNLTWFPHATLAAQTVSSTGNIIVPVRAIRVNVASLTGGTLTFRAQQAG